MQQKVTNVRAKINIGIKKIKKIGTSSTILKISLKVCVF
jgi:hypothetical protein